MPDSETEAFVAGHFVVMEERKAFTELHLAHALRIGGQLTAALKGLDGQKVASVPVAIEPEPEPVAPSIAEPLPARYLAPDVSFDLRQRLGLE